MLARWEHVGRCACEHVLEQETVRAGEQEQEVHESREKLWPGE